MRLISTLLLLLGLLVTGVLGTETGLLFYWPGCMVLGLAGFATAARWKMRLSFAPNDLCLLSVILLCVYLAGRAYVSPVIQYGREDLFIILGCYVAYLLTATVVSHPRWRMRIMAVIVLLIIGNMAVGFVQFSGNWAYHVVPGFARPYGAEGRVGGFYTNANHLAAFLLMAINLMLGIVCFGRGNATSKLLWSFTTLTAAIVAALTLSRGAVFAGAACVVTFALISLWLIWKTQRHVFNKLVIGVAVILLLIGCTLYLVGKESVKQRMDNHHVLNDIRYVIWEIAKDQHSLSPWIGSGARMFSDLCMTLRPATMPTWSLDAGFVHNEYLQMLADYGWVGLGLAAFAILMHLIHGLKFIRWFVREKFEHTSSLLSNTLGLTVGAFSGLVGVLVHAVVEFHFHVAATAILAAVLAGILANPGFNSTSVSLGRLNFVRPVAKVLLLLAGTGMIYGAVKQAPADYAAAQAALALVKEDRAEQVDQLTRSVELYPDSAEPWYCRGLAWMQQWRADLPTSVQERLLKKAVADFQQAVALQPTRYLYPLGLADAYDAMHQEKEAKAAVDLALKYAPMHEQTRLSLAIHYHRWQRFDKAEQAYLWCRESHAPSVDPNMLRWYDGYMQLMTDAGKAAQLKTAP